jgi:catechol 2,3-dioxygenase-like lactoylglutathione lyase family enzyme
MPPGREEEVRHFYGAVLGMQEIPKPPVLAARGGAWFRAGEMELHLGVEEDFRRARKAHPGILVAAIESLAEQLQAAGAQVEWDDNFPGFRRFYSWDPLGNRLEFLEPVEAAGRVDDPSSQLGGAWGPGPESP